MHKKATNRNTPNLNRTGPCGWNYGGVALIADGYPRKEQLQLVDQLNPSAKKRISHIHHFDDPKGNCVCLQVVWIEPEPSTDEVWQWLFDWDGAVWIQFGIIPVSCHDHR